jgi:hypothetical protein
MTEFQKRIYNKHLAVSKIVKNKPFKVRVNFENVDEPRLMSLRKIEVFLGKYPEVDIDSYFLAPYKLYPDVEYFDLSYYASPRAIKSYSLYSNIINLQQPDQQKTDVTKSLQFIGAFCIKQKINLDDYSIFRNDLEPCWVYHLKTGKINCYTLMEFPGIYSVIEDMPQDERVLLLGGFGANFLEYKNKYNNSKILKPYLITAYQKVKFFVDKTLHKP